MKNIYFPDEEITENDLFFICSMIERVARIIHQRNKYVVNTIGKKNMYHLLTLQEPKLTCVLRIHLRRSKIILRQSMRHLMIRGYMKREHKSTMSRANTTLPMQIIEK